MLSENSVMKINVGQEVRLEGIYWGKDEKFSNRFVVVLTDVRVFDIEHNELDFIKDHTWIQEAWSLKELKLKLGDKVSLIATVQNYWNKKSEVGIGFTSPRAIEWQPLVL